MTAALAWTVVVVAALQILNGLYVAAEFALIGSRRSQLQALVRGKPRAGRILAVVSDIRSLDRWIATAQIGITLASLGLGMYGEHAVARLLAPHLAALGPGSWLASHTAASLLAVGGLTFLHIVIGEMVPKSLALQNPPRMSMAIEPALRLSNLALRPLVATLVLLGNALLRLLQVKPSAEAERVLNLDEIESVIDESGAGGVLHAGQAEILGNLFDFEDLLVRKVMLPRNRVTGLEVNAGHDEILRAVRKTRHTRYPVYEGDLDDVIGYVHVRDLMGPLQESRPPDLRSLCRPVPQVPETATCARLFRAFRRRRVQIAVVLDEHGGTAGIATLQDLMQEIFGDVPVDTSREGAEIWRGPDGLVRVSGSLRLDEMNEALGLDLAEKHVDTVGGLVLARLGRMARKGDRIRGGRVLLTVEQVDHQAVTRIRVSSPAETPRKRQA